MSWMPLGFPTSARVAVRLGRDHHERTKKTGGSSDLGTDGINTRKYLPAWHIPIRATRVSDGAYDAPGSIAIELPR
jgi:hypothetical protein